MHGLSQSIVAALRHSPSTCRGKSQSIVAQRSTLMAAVVLYLTAIRRSTCGKSVAPPVVRGGLSGGAPRILSLRHRKTTESPRRAQL